MNGNVVVKISIALMVYATSLVVLAATFLHANIVGSERTDYYIMSEGQPFPILNPYTQKGEPLFEIQSDSYELFPHEADLNIATVYVAQDVPRWYILAGKTFLKNEVEVRSLKEEFLEAGGTLEQWDDFQFRRLRQILDNDGNSEMYKTMLNDSANSAAAAALMLKGVELDYSIKIASVGAETPAEKAGLQAGDLITHINNKSQSIVSLANYLQTIPGTALDYTILRDGEIIKKTITAEPNPAAGGRLLIGITGSDVADLPFEVIFRHESVGGASAGLIFSIAAYEYLTEEKLLLPDVKYGGTGGITPEGIVLPIDGLTQKISAADKSGHDYFFIPEEMCEKVVWQDSWNLKIIPVDTLETAVTMLRKIVEQRTEDLNECTK
jgi:PDZ domain-containing secreted protein